MLLTPTGGSYSSNNSSFSNYWGICLFIFLLSTLLLVIYVNLHVNFYVLKFFNFYKILYYIIVSLFIGAVFESRDIVIVYFIYIINTCGCVFDAFCFTEASICFLLLFYLLFNFYFIFMQNFILGFFKLSKKYIFFYLFFNLFIFLVYLNIFNYF